jgi:hypothetical protein
MQARGPGAPGASALPRPRPPVCQPDAALRLPISRPLFASSSPTP